jgi:hypothetical protein
MENKKLDHNLINLASKTLTLKHKILIPSSKFCLENPKKIDLNLKP